jgi:hypothetical protein
MKTQNTKYQFTITPTNKAAFVRTSDDRNFEEAMETAKMFQNCFPGAKVEFSNRAL